MTIANNLENAACSHPFRHLGRVKINGKNGIRAWLPNATDVCAEFNAGDNTIQCELNKIDARGLFEATIEGFEPTTVYRLRVTNEQTSYTIDDPYQFQKEAFYGVHFIDHKPENLYRQGGAQQISINGIDKSSATRFVVYAPNASAVSVIGDFNHWDGRYHPMEKTDLGFWVLVMPNAHVDMRYKYQIKDDAGNLLPHKSDPLGFFAEQYPSHASIVFDHNQFEWKDSLWMETRKQDKYTTPISIYEVHLGSWRHPEEKERRYLNYRELSEALIKYVKHMNYTHIELMPVSEFPFDGSWGYQPVGMFAPTSRFGDPNEFKFFVDQCHQNGIGVIIDWVPAHFPEDGHGLARFDGSCVYEYEDPRRGWHPDWNSCIYDFGKDSVRQFLVASALMWLDYFHIDGLRVDAVASMLYLDYSRNDGDWIPNIDGGNENYEAISLLQWMNKEVYQQHPGAMTIAEESTSFPKVSRPVFEGGLGFGFKWNMGWMHDSLHYISKDPAYRRYHHGDITFSMVYAYNENFILPISHDEVVHGKGSLIGKMPGDEWQQAANLRCYAAFMFAHPGKKLSFMGNEFGQHREWNHDGELDWALLEQDKHKGIQHLYKRLNEAYQSYPALYENDHDIEGFEWIDHENSDQSILSFIRHSKDKKQSVYVICNFTPIPRNDFRLGLASAGRLKLIINTDSTNCWGSHYPIEEYVVSQPHPMHNKPHSMSINIPPLSTQYWLMDN